jgi:hypothetical protein
MDSSTSLIVVGDGHIKRSSIVRSQKMCDDILEYVDKIKPDATILLGDFHHTHDIAYQEPFDLCMKFIISLSKKTPVFFVTGNHEILSHAHYLTDKHFLNPLKFIPNITIVDYPLHSRIKNHDFAFVPYVAPGLFKDTLKLIFPNDEDMRKMRAVYSHQEYRGAKMGSVISEVGDVWEVDLPLIISGHVHGFDILQSNIIYVGTPIQDNFSEDPNKGIFHFLFHEDNTHTMTKLPIKVPVKRTYRLTIEEFKKFTLPENIEAKIIVRSSPEEFRSVERSGTVQKFKDLGAIVHHDDITAKRSVETIEKDREFSHVLFDKLKGDQELLDVFNSLFKSEANGEKRVVKKPRFNIAGKNDNSKLEGDTIKKNDSKNLTEEQAVEEKPVTKATKKPSAPRKPTDSRRPTAPTKPADTKPTKTPVVRFKIKKSD